MQAINQLLGPRKQELETPRIPRNKSKKTQQETDNIAEYLVNKFQSPEHRPLFLKVAWRLERGTIDRHVASAFELGKNPRAYFISCVKKDKAYHA